LYFSYFDKTGDFCKPFLLPQKDPGYNAALLKSYNIPELIKTKILPGPRAFARFVRSEAKKSTYKNSE
jgi:hypothetical protein